MDKIPIKLIENICFYGGFFLIAWQTSFWTAIGVTVLGFSLLITGARIMVKNGWIE